jgi:hypothetical protein
MMEGPPEHATVGTRRSRHPSAVLRGAALLLTALWAPACSGVIEATSTDGAVGLADGASPADAAGDDAGSREDGTAPRDGTPADAGSAEAATPPADAAPDTAANDDAGPPAGPAYFVSPTGSDSADGTSPSTPFRTLTKAQSAMQASATKTTYVMGGTYAMSATLTLDGSDAGESWLGYPGQTPVLDGANAINQALEVNADNVTIRWLTIKSCTESGIVVQGAQHVTIDSNTITDISSSDWNQAGIRLCSSTYGGRVTHNLIDTCGYVGIGVWAAGSESISDVLVDRNEIYNTCLSVADCGAIYSMDRGHIATGIQITNNVIGNYGNHATLGRGIYLDDQLSNVTVSGNIVYGTGEWALQIHGGDHHLFQNNVFDISEAPTLGLYQDDSPGQNYGMAGNVFTCNIVWSSTAPGSALWDYINQSGGSITLPDVHANVYWDTTGANLPNTGTIVDSSPTVADPRFVDPAQHDYAFQAGPPLPCFQAMDTSQVGPLPH